LEINSSKSGLHSAQIVEERSIGLKGLEDMKEFGRWQPIVKTKRKSNFPVDFSLARA
jgi:hypothetical protein